MFTADGSDLSPQLKVFAQTIGEGPLGLAYYQPQSWAQPRRCFENAHQQAQRHGGRAIFGWMFHYRVVADIPGPGYLIAVHHAVWHAPAGQLVDVTPFLSDPKHKPITSNGDVLFLVDRDAKPIVVGQTIGPRASQFFAINADRRLAAHVQQLQNEELDAHRRLFPSG